MLEEQFLKNTLIRYLKQQNVSLKSLNEIHKRIEFYDSMLAQLKITMSDGLPFEKFKVDLSENYLFFFNDNLITDIELLDSYSNNIKLNQSFSELSKAIELSISLSRIIVDIDNFFDFDKDEKYKRFKNIETFILDKITELEQYKLLKIKDNIQVINPQALNAFNLGFYLLMEMDEIPYGNYKRGLYDYYFDYFNCRGFHGMQWTSSNSRCILPRQFFEIAFNLDSNFSEAKIYFELCDYLLNRNIEKFKNEVIIRYPENAFANIFYTYILCKNNLQDEEESAFYLNKALKQGENSSFIYFLAGELKCTGVRDYMQKHWLEESIKIYNKNPIAYIGLLNFASGPGEKTTLLEKAFELYKDPYDKLMYMDKYYEIARPYMTPDHLNEFIILQEDVQKLLDENNSRTLEYLKNNVFVNFKTFEFSTDLSKIKVLLDDSHSEYYALNNGSKSIFITEKITFYEIEKIAQVNYAIKLENGKFRYNNGEIFLRNIDDIYQFLII